MKIKIIDVNYIPEEGVLTLEECGFKVGDVLEVTGRFGCGSLLARAIRDTELVSIGQMVSFEEGEYKVVEE